MKAVIFDLDGTLIDSLADIAESINLMLDARGWPRCTPNTFKQMVGDGMEKLVERALPEAQRTPTLIKECTDEYRAQYESHWKDQTRPYDGVLGTLHQLAKRDIKLGVISNKAHRFTVPMTEHFFGPNRFDFIYGQRDDVERKPAPAAAFQMAREMGLLTSDCVYVGDSGIDMKFAKAAKMKAIGVRWGFREADELLACGADELIARPEELILMASGKWTRT